LTRRLPCDVSALSRSHVKSPTRLPGLTPSSRTNRSCLYLTTLSFDGIMLSWLKAERGFSDSFIALMRAVCVFAGLGGTFAFQLLERNLGLLRAGAWSLW
jgi:iron-regulated transporter 1